MKTIIKYTQINYNDVLLFLNYYEISFQTIDNETFTLTNALHVAC